MFLARLPILTFVYSIFLLPPISTFAGDFYTHSPVDFTFNHDNIAVPVPASPTTESRKTVLGFGHGNAIATGAIILITLLNVAVYMLRLLYEANSGEKLDTTEQLCRRFSLGEILSATGNFDESLVIGKGGFGKVYKGVIDINGPTTVAIKRLNPMSKQGAPEFWTEIEMLSKFRHSHLVSLIGYCDSYNEMALVYEYMIRGTLADHLHKIDKNDNNSSLSWVQRLRICIGAARGLDYLHTGTGIQHRVIHRDVKSTNILLDENWAAKISDFGLSKFGPADQTCTHVSTNNIKGTFGYLDPEYFLTRRFSRKSDVYAFGVVLFEVLCERPAIDLSLDGEQRGLAGWAQQCLKEGTIEQIIGPSLKWQILPKSLTAFVQIAGQCLHNRLKKRPTMAEIVVKLEFALALQVSTDSSVIEGDIINNMDSYAEDKQIDEIIRVGDSIGKQSLKKPKMTFTRKVLLFFSVIALNTHTDAKSSRNAKSNNNSGYNSKLPNKDGGFVLEVPSSGQIVIPNLKMFTFAELKSATRNFRLDMLLGEGAFGKVFKGWVDEKTYAPSKAGVGKAVAVKRLTPDSFHGPKEVLTEVEYLGKFSHPNLVELLGHCSEDKEFLIVYEYMQKGSLDFHLFRSVALPWVTRLKIAIGAARGLAFLHSTDGQVIHRSVKTSDILLDGDFNAKLSDFGLAKIGPPNGKSHVSTRVMGTYGFAAPEYLATGCLYVKSDVYSFGVVLLEMLTGQKVVDRNRPSGKQNLADWAKPLLRSKRKLKRVMDPQLEHDCPPEGAFQFAALILKCLENYPKDRPSMEEVLETLEQINTI